MVGFKHTLCALLLTMVTGMAIAHKSAQSVCLNYNNGRI